MARIGVNLRVTGHCSQGGRKYMEDMFAVAYQQTVDMSDLEYAFCGIFDGHGGPQAAVYAKDHLLDAIVSQRNFWSENDEDILRAIHDGFITTHYTMWKDVDKWPKTPQGLPSTSGTTATIAFIKRGKIYIGHVGDTCIVLGLQPQGEHKWKAQPLTRDHKPENTQEMLRIQRAGGKVMTKSGIHRVVWNRPQIGHQGPVRRSTPMDEIPFLAVARSLGDFWSYNSQLDQFVVSPEPDVRVFRVDTRFHRCLIFGTDGLWNILSPEDAVLLVQSTEKRNGERDKEVSDDWLNPSKCLVDTAMDKWKSYNLRADNTSVVVLLLDPPGPPNSSVLIRGNSLLCTPQHSREFNNGLPREDCDEVPRSGGLAIFTHYPNRSVPQNAPSCSSMMPQNEHIAENKIDDCEESDDDDDEEEDDDLIEESENEESDNNDDNSDDTNEHSLAEGFSSFISNYSSLESTNYLEPSSSPQQISSTSSSKTSADDSFRSCPSWSSQQSSYQKVTEQASMSLNHSLASGSEDLTKLSPKCRRKRPSESEILNEEFSSSDVENESVFPENKRRRVVETLSGINWKKPLTFGSSTNTENQDSSSGDWFIDSRQPSWKKPIKPVASEGSSDTENETTSSQWFVDNRKTSWKKPVKTVTSEGSSDTENETTSNEWFIEPKKRKLSIDKKSPKPNWQKPLPVSGKIHSLKEKPVDESKRTLRSDTSAAMRVKTLRSRNVDLKSSCDKRDSIIKLVNPKREVNTSDMEMDTKSVKGTSVNSGRYRTKRASAPPRWSPSIHSVKKCKLTRSQAARNLGK